MLESIHRCQTDPWAAGRGELWENEAAELMIGAQTQLLLERAMMQPNPANCCKNKKPGRTVIVSVCAFQKEKVNVNVSP